MCVMLIAFVFTGPGPSFENFTSSHGEHRTHEGYLYKKGAVFKGWKQRWFVLDSMKHQVSVLEVWDILTFLHIPLMRVCLDLMTLSIL